MATYLKLNSLGQTQVASSINSFTGNPDQLVSTNAFGFIDSTLIQDNNVEGVNEFYTVSSVASNATVNIINRTITEPIFKLVGFDLSGNCRGIFRVYLDANLVAIGRINYLAFNKILNFSSELIPTSSILLVTVENVSTEIAAFEARLVYKEA
jgi:hypothetical protein